jgi:hypothetical protein
MNLRLYQDPYYYCRGGLASANSRKGEIVEFLFLSEKNIGTTGIG